MKLILILTFIAYITIIGFAIFQWQNHMANISQDNLEEIEIRNQEHVNNNVFSKPIRYYTTRVPVYKSIHELFPLLHHWLIGWSICLLSSQNSTMRTWISKCSYIVGHVLFLHGIIFYGLGRPVTVTLVEVVILEYTK